MNIEVAQGGEAGTSPIRPHPILLVEVIRHHVPEKAQSTWCSETVEVSMCHAQNPTGSLYPCQGMSQLPETISIHKPHLCQPYNTAGWPPGQLLLSSRRKKICLGLDTGIHCSWEHSETSEWAKVFSHGHHVIKECD